MKKYLVLILCLFLLTSCWGGSKTLPTATTQSILPMATDTPALPTATLVPTLPTIAVPSFTPPAGVSACKPEDLTASAVTDVATGSLTFNVKLTNKSAAACRMPNPAKFFLAQPGKTDNLQLNPYYACFLCSLATPGAPTLEPTAQAEQFSRLMAETIDLQPGESVRVFLIWSNWCGNLVPNLAVRLKLDTADLLIPSDASANPPCLADNAPSSLMISQYIH